MADLLDIRRRVRIVLVDSDDGPKDVPVHGLKAGAIADILGRFPALQEMLFPAGVSRPATELSDASSLIRAAPEAIAAILAAGTGHSGEADHEAAAAELPIESQIDLLSATLELTLPGGFVPFVEKLTALFGTVSAQSGAARVLASARELSTVPNLSNGKASDTPSPSQ